MELIILFIGIAIILVLIPIFAIFSGIRKLIKFVTEKIEEFHFFQGKCSRFWIILNRILKKLFPDIFAENQLKSNVKLLYTKLSPLCFPRSLNTRIFSNVSIPQTMDQQTEFDLIMLSPHGIIVFIAQNYIGKIVGDASQSKWYFGKKSAKNIDQMLSFDNPIEKAQHQIQHLKHILGDDVPVASMIVFPENCIIPSELNHPYPNIVITKTCSVQALVKATHQKASSVLKKEQLETIHEILNSFT